MRKRICLFVALVSAFSGLFFGFAEATSCSTTGTIGGVALSVVIPTPGNYIVWTRLKTPAPSAHLLRLEVGGNTCYEVGSTDMPKDTWTWINYQNNQPASTIKYNFTNAGTKQIKIYGLAESTQVDKVIFIGENEQCSSNGQSPVADGKNCDTAVAASGGSNTTTPAIVSNNPTNISKVDYYVDGTLAQSVDGASGLNTSNLSDGTHELTTKVTYKDGTTGEGKETISVVKGTGALSKSKARSKTIQLVLLVSAGVVLALTAITVAVILRIRYHKRMYQLHHGLSL